MSYFLCKLGEVKNRDGEDYYSLKCISVIDGKERTILFPVSFYSFKESTLYRIDVEDQDCTALIEINNWHTLNNEVLIPFSKYFKDKFDTFETCAFFIREIASTPSPDNNSIITKILRYVGDDDLELFQCNLLIAVIRKNKWVGWAIDEAKRLFSPESEGCSYYIDIEEEVFELLKSCPNDVCTWEDAIQHDPTIVELATSQEEKDIFISRTPIDHMNSILSRKGYNGIYTKEIFMKLHSKTIRSHAELLKLFIGTNAVIFDLEGNADGGYAWEYYIRKIGKAKDDILFQRRLDDNGKYHHITQKEWDPFDVLISSAQMIVGHNIRRHDRVLLENRECEKLSVDNRKIWDTLEIELLLDPTRDSYALKVHHLAKEDVLVTENVFWTQLKRILSKEEDYLKVRDFLPECVNEYIANNIYAAEKPYLSNALGKGKENADLYFYKYQHFYCPNLMVKEGTLIVTPKHYWKDLSRVIDNVSFICNDEPIDHYAHLDGEKVRLAFSESNDAIERAIYYLVSGRERTRLSDLPDYFINSIGIEKLSTLIDIHVCAECLNVFCTDPYNFVSCKQQIPTSIKHVILMNIDDCNTLGGKMYPGISQHEQNELYNILCKKGSYSCFKKRLSIQNDELSSIVRKKDICEFSFWAFQSSPHAIELMYFVEPRRIVDSLKEMSHFEISEEEWHLGVNKEGNISYATLVGIDYRFPSSTDNRESYWRQQFEIISNVRTELPKVWILDSAKEVDDVCSCLNIERQKCFHFKAYRTLEKVADNPTQICIISWDDIIINKRSLDNNYYFIINDLARFVSIPDLSYENINEVPIIHSIVLGIFNELCKFGFGSKLCIIDPVFETYKHLQPRVFGYENIINIISNSEYQSNPATNCISNSRVDDVIQWVENESDLLYNPKEKIHYSLTDIQKLAIQRRCLYHGPIRNFLTIIPTGGGKSVIFQGPILYNLVKRNGKKLSVVITPLQALMKDQVDEIVGKNSKLYKGKVAYIHSGVPASKQTEIIRKIRHQEVSLLYIAPERLLFSHFFKKAILYASVNQGIDSIIFDEAHCITSWGTEFRPSYIFALKKCIELQERNPEIAIQMFTATMSAQSERELHHYINIPPENVVPRKDSDNIIEQRQYKEALCPIRPHISLMVKEVEQVNSTEQLRKKVSEIWSLISCNEFLGTQALISGRSRAIIFTKSRNDAGEGAKLLKELVHGSEIEAKIDFFHAKLGDKEKERIADKYNTGEILILFSTKAFGLGMNVKNIHFVGHLSPPSFIEDYLQEVGRAGRDINLLPQGQKTLKAICLYTQNDIKNIDNYDDGLEWADISHSFDAIIEYLKRIKQGDLRNYYAIPLNLLRRETNGNDQDGEDCTQPDNTIFMQALSWLADPILGRIKLGFFCSDVYELKFNPDRKGLIEGSAVKHLYNYANKIYLANEGCDYIALRTNDIISNPIYDVNSPEELDHLIENCIDCGIFSRDYMYVGVSIKKGNHNFVINEVRDFFEGKKPLGNLSLLCIMLNNDNGLEQFEDVFNSAFSKYTRDYNLHPSNNMRNTLFSILLSSWEYASSLTSLYSVDEIKAKSEKLIKILFANYEKSIHLLKLLQEMDINNDVDELKIFVLLLHKLNYLDKDNLGFDYIEVNIVDERPIKIENPDGDDKSAKTYFEYIDAVKKDKAHSMSMLIRDFSSSELCKERIREYSQYVRPIKETTE